MPKVSIFNLANSNNPIVFAKINEIHYFFKVCFPEEVELHSIEIRDISTPSLLTQVEKIKTNSNGSQAVVFLVDSTIESDISSNVFALGLHTGFSISTKINRPILFISLNNGYYQAYDKHGLFIHHSHFKLYDLCRNAILYYLKEDISNFWLSYSNYLIQNINEVEEINLELLSDETILTTICDFKHPCTVLHPHIELQIVTELTSNFRKYADQITVRLSSRFQIKENDKTIGSYKTLKLFLASSMSLEERREFPGIILQLNKLLKSDGIQIEPVLCDLDAPSGDYGGGRFQDHFNRLLADCEVALVLFYNRVGAFTLEEMQIARKSCRKTFVYFKRGFAPTDDTEIDDLSEVFKIKKEIIGDESLVIVTYDHLSEFKQKITTDIQKYLKGL